jgi:hypothetical protein
MRCHIPKATKEVALRLSHRFGLSDPDIRQYTGISERATRRIRKLYNEIGEVVQVPICPGRPRLLDSLHANVSLTIFLTDLIY